MRLKHFMVFYLIFVLTFDCLITSSAVEVEVSTTLKINSLMWCV